MTDFDKAEIKHMLETRPYLGEQCNNCPHWIFRQQTNSLLGRLCEIYTIPAAVLPLFIEEKSIMNESSVLWRIISYLFTAFGIFTVLSLATVALFVVARFLLEKDDAKYSILAIPAVIISIIYICSASL